MTRIMAITAHPQDLFERCGGTVANHLELGAEAMFVSLTTGVVTHAFDIFPATGEDKLKDADKVKEMKRQELERAAEVLGVQEWRMLDFPESPMMFGLDEYVAVVNLIREFRPDVVLCPHQVEFGRHDHMDAGRFAVAAVDYVRAEGFPSALAPHTVPNLFMFYYQNFSSDQHMGATRHGPDVIVDITSVIDKKVAAMLEFSTTQTKKGEDRDEKIKRFMASIDGGVGYMHGLGYAEQFVRLEPHRGPYLPLAE